MSDLDDLKAKVLDIVKEHKVDYSNPLSVSELISELGEGSKGMIHYALMSLTLEGKLGTIGAGSEISINKVINKN